MKRKLWRGRLIPPRLDTGFSNSKEGVYLEAISTEQALEIKMGLLFETELIIAGSYSWTMPTVPL